MHMTAQQHKRRVEITCKRDGDVSREPHLAPDADAIRFHLDLILMGAKPPNPHEIFLAEHFLLSSERRTRKPTVIEAT